MSFGEGHPGTVSKTRAIVLVFGASLFCLTAGWAGAVLCAEERRISANSAGEPAPPTDDNAPSFASLSGQRDAVSIDRPLAPGDLAAIILADRRATTCSDALIRAQWQQDYVPQNRFLEAAHFDNCQIDASFQYMREQYARANAAASSGDVFKALRHLGYVLHSVQDFYAHTNFVELAAERWPQFTALPTQVLWEEHLNESLEELRPHLLSGLWGWERIWPSDRCPQGTPTHGNLNKDSADSARGQTLIRSWGMTHYRAALELTKASMKKLLRDMMRRNNWSQVVAACGTSYGFGLRGDAREE